jgi:signal peptidase I
MRWRALAFVGVVVAGVIGQASRIVYTVSDDEMAPGLLPGDRVWLANASPNVGDVVQLVDPLDPERTILRRVLAVAGATVSFNGDVAKVNEASFEHIEMFRDASLLVLRERDSYQVQREPGATHLQIAPQQVPAEHVFLAADNRGLGVDSRWWGPIPQSAILGVAVWRMGQANAWQDRTGRP